MALGIRTVYQELSLLPHLSVAENVLLGRLPTAGLPFIDRLGGGEPDRRPGARRLRLPRDRPDGARRLAQRRPPADRRDRQGAGHRAAHPHPRRADGGALGRGDRAALRHRPPPRRRRRHRPLHLAPARGDLRDRRRDRGAEGRRERAGRAGRRARPGADHPRHGRPPAVGGLSRQGPARPAAWCSRSRASASAGTSRT